MSAPRVSIGLPVYNGARHLEATLDALLCQDFSDFELIISDNASTDATEAICRSFAARDPRIRYLRQPENIGGARNFGFVLDQAKASYFMWAGHDDRFAPSYVSRMLEALDRNPGAVLACSQIRFIGPADEDLPEWKGFPNLHTVGLSRAERVRQMFRRTGWYAIYGLSRPEHLRRAGIAEAVFGHDVRALMRLLLLGDIVCVDDVLFEYRIEQIKAAADYRTQLGAGVGANAPYTELFVALLRIVFESDWQPEEKEEILLDALLTLISENRTWRRRIVRESLFFASRRGRGSFARYMCVRLSRELRSGFVPWTSLVRYAKLRARMRPQLG
jgi:glycosyltransferase involved in cell wall biosynthesis